MIEAIREARNYLQDILPRTPKVGIVLGTGLSGLASMVKDPVVIPYGEVPHHPVSTAPSHVGQYVFGSLEGVDVLMMQGRLHYYEGYTMQEITFPIRVMQGAGITHLIVTNAAGSLNESMQPGDLVILRDHINFMGTNPLIGPDDPLLGERFPACISPTIPLLLTKLRLSLPHTTSPSNRACTPQYPAPVLKPQPNATCSWVWDLIWWECPLCRKLSSASRQD